MSTRDHDNVVRRSFEQQRSLFSAPDSPFARRNGSLAWIEPLSAEMAGLDVACGAAHAAESVAARVRQVVALDLTAALLALGAERLRTNGITNVLLMEGKAEALPFVDESFDVVFCRSSLHHFANPLEAVAEMVRVCREGGRVVLLDIVPPSNDVRDRFDNLHRLIDPSHVRSFLEVELADVLPGGVEALDYADTFTLRLPIDVALTDQSQTEGVLALLRREIEGTEDASGFQPAEEEGKIVVSFTTSVVHGPKSVVDSR